MPEGWKLVPVEPTDSMLNALEDVDTPHIENAERLSWQDYQRIRWRQIIDRAPSPSEAEQRWIPISERLPDSDQPVACIEPGVTWGNEKPDYGVMLFAIYKDGVFMVDKPTPYCNPTHWMPLPPMPSSSDTPQE